MAVKKVNVARPVHDNHYIIYGIYSEGEALIDGENILELPAVSSTSTYYITDEVSTLFDIKLGDDAKIVEEAVRYQKDNDIQV